MLRRALLSGLAFGGGSSWLAALEAVRSSSQDLLILGQLAEASASSMVASTADSLTTPVSTPLVAALSAGRSSGCPACRVASASNAASALPGFPSASDAGVTFAFGSAPSEAPMRPPRHLPRP
uniref:Putative secreted protein n=1 Tax=Ixodes ricinus TaxID=34613 RepID=A0A6B0UPC2_IXORI